MDLASKLRGMKDSRSMIGMLSRGKNVYNSTSHSANRFQALARKRVLNGNKR